MPLDLIDFEDASPAERARGCDAAARYLAQQGVTPEQGWAAVCAYEAFEPWVQAHLDAWRRATQVAIEAALGEDRWNPAIPVEDAELVWRPTVSPGETAQA